MMGFAGSPIKQERNGVRKHVLKTGMKKPEDFYPKVNASINSGVGSAYKLGTPMSPYASGNFKIKTFKQE